MKHFNALVALFAIGAYADSEFIIPQIGHNAEDPRDNMVWAEGEEIEIVWETDLESVALGLRQAHPNINDEGIIFTGSNSPQGFTFVFDLDDYDLSGLRDGEFASFYFGLYDTSDMTVAAWSHDFNITSETSTSPSVTSSTTSSRPTSTSSTSTTSSEDPEETDPGSSNGNNSGDDEDDDNNNNSGNNGNNGNNDGNNSGSSNSSNDDGGLSTGAIIGIAIGSALGAILILAGIGFFVWRRYRANKTVAPTTPSMTYAPQPGYPPQPQQQMPQAMYPAHPHQSYQPYPMQAQQPPQMYAGHPVDHNDVALKSSPSPATIPRYSVAPVDPAATELEARREY